MSPDATSEQVDDLVDVADAPAATSGMDEATRERLRALRAAQAMPLRARRGFGHLHIDPAPPLPALRPGRGLGALLLPAPREAEPVRVVERVVERVAPAAEQPAAVTVELDWLLARDLPGRLHHASLDVHALTDLAADSYVEAAPGAALPLACGAIVARVSLPGVDDRQHTARCAGCCSDRGYPPGTGSPRNDPACRAVLAGHVTTAGGLS